MESTFAPITLDGSNGTAGNGRSTRRSVADRHRLLAVLADRHAAQLADHAGPIDYSGLIETTDPEQCPGQLMIPHDESDRP